MSFAYALLIAITQGVTEFLPVSSAGHLVLLAHISGAAAHGLVIDVAAHFGTLCAAMIYFRKDLSAVIFGAASFVVPAQAAARNQERRRLVFFVILASVPALIVGAALFMTGAIDLLRDIKILAAANLIFAVLLFLADRAPEAKADWRSMSWRQAALIGLAQMTAFIPGASRAGVCITMARALGFSRVAAARFALFLAIPAIGGAIVLGASRIDSLADLSAAAVVAVLSFAVSFCVLSGFVRMSRSVSLTPFVIYRLILAALLFML